MRVDAILGLKEGPIVKVNLIRAGATTDEQRAEEHQSNGRGRAF